MKSNLVKAEDPSMHIIKMSNCPSLSGRSTLTYHIAYKGDHPCDEASLANPNVHLRIYENTGRGFFSDEWIPLVSIQSIFEKEAVEEMVTSTSLNAIFGGRSVNTAGFLFAVLKVEGLVSNRDIKRKYKCLDFAPFVQEVKRLMESGTKLEVSPSVEVPSKERNSTIQKGKKQKG